MSQQRLQKVLAAAGIDSRRNCEQLILDGAVRVNRQLVDTLPAFVDPDKDRITVNGRTVQTAARVYYLLNKSKGVICTSSDPQGRKKAVDMVNCTERIFCVGRLDADTTGLIILTNDSELTNRLTHPRYEIPKTYLVTVKGTVNTEQVEKLKKGVWLSEGRTNRSSIKLIHNKPDQSAIEITIRQGLNRQIRRMFAKVDLKIKSLKRIKIGKITAKGLGVGQSRKLRQAEIDYLKKVCRL